MNFIICETVFWVEKKQIHMVKNAADGFRYFTLFKIVLYGLEYLCMV